MNKLGLIETDRLIADGRQLSDETIIRLKKLENDMIIARLGLQGTLWGTWAGLLVVIIIVLLPVVSKTTPVVDGWQVVAIISAIVVSVVFYGAFIFDRALRVSGKLGATAFEADTAAAGAPARTELRPKALVRSPAA